VGAQAARLPLAEEVLAEVIKGVQQVAGRPAAALEVDQGVAADQAAILEVAVAAVILAVIHPLQLQ
jgi:hypothetical protein